MGWVVVTVTWLQSDGTNSFIGSVTPLVTNVRMLWGRSSGVGFFICNNNNFEVLPQPFVNTFESISDHLSMDNAQDIIFHTVNRPPITPGADR